MSAPQPATLGDRLRAIAQTLRQETDTQIKATSRILGAAAQMAQNHDHLIDEVVDMVEEDLARGQQPSAATYDESALKREFKTLKAAKAHFGIKANSWAMLATKLNQTIGEPPTGKDSSPSEVLARLDRMEQDIRALQETLDQVLTVLQKIVGEGK